MPPLRLIAVPLATFLLPLTATGQSPARGDDVAATVSAARSYRSAHERSILGELTALLAIPNVAADSTNIRRNARAVMDLLERRGIRARQLDSPAGGPPAVFGELRAPGATRTVVFYAHYDGQPVDDPRWITGPFQPTLRSAALEAGGHDVALPPSGPVDATWRLYARSASDDKAPIVGLLTALDALRSAGRAPSVNLKFFFEGEEEAGSPHLAPLLDAHAPLLAADAWIFCDGPVHASGLPQIVYGVRGTMGLEMTLYGPARSLHSGHYGNWAPNPVALLAHLLASMRDPDGRILIRHFADDVRAPSASERAALATVPMTDADLRARLQLGATEEGNAPLAARLLLPALNVRGVDGGFVGKRAVNAIPAAARASIDFRLVPDQTPSHVRATVEAHIAAQGYHIVHAPADSATRVAHPRVILLDWDAGYPAMRTAMDLPLSRAVAAIADTVAGRRVARLPSLGGSLPMNLFADRFHVPLIVVPIANADNGQHGPNENLRLANLWAGIDLYAALFAHLGSAFPR